MIAEAAALHGARVLIDGCGVGSYAAQIAERFGAHVEAMDIEPERVAVARRRVPRALIAAAEHLPYASNAFDVVLSNEVLEHVQDDRAAACEMVRVTKPQGVIIIFCPNRWYPFETHGHYWRGKYHFGNTPLINYLPDGLRNRLAPHVRVYTASGLRGLFVGLPARVVMHTQIYPGYDNVVARRPRLGRWLRRVTYALEASPLARFGISHVLVVEKV